MDDVFPIDIWSDVVCPFCCIGHQQLRRALAQFEHVESVALRFRAFELDVNAPATYGRSLDDLVARKYGLDATRARHMHERLEAEAAELGMRWDLQRAQPGNTRDAHRLIAFAGTQDLQSAMVERLFAAYFEHGRVISDHDTLNDLASEVGVVHSASLWTSLEFVDDVIADEDDALELGISGVPAFLVDRRFVINGARDPADILDVLRRAWARRSS